MKPRSLLPNRLLNRLQWVLAIAVLAPVAGLFAAERDTVKVLAIGNSFSEDATRQLPAVAKAGDKTLILGRASIGGCSLERHARHLAEAEAGNPDGRAYKGFVDPKTGEKRTVTVIEALSADTWDVVTLQQVSTQSFKRDSFQPHLDRLIAAVRKYAPTAEIVIHETWAYREDHPIFKKDDGFTPLKMYEDLRANYRHFADKNSFRILPVGDAFHLARQTPRWTYVPDASFDFKNPPADKLPDQSTSLNSGWRWTTKEGKAVLSLDAIHSNAAGQYLGACVWYLQLFGADTLPTSYIPKGYTAEDAETLRTHALAAVQAERTRTSTKASVSLSE